MATWNEDHEYFKALSLMTGISETKLRAASSRQRTQPARIDPPLLQPDTYAEIAKINTQSVAYAEAVLGVREHEPLLVAMDGMLRYARAYRKAYGDPVGTDGVLGDAFADVIKGLRALLNGHGAVAMERGMSGDSKNNGVIESLYWLACEAAGIDGDS